MSIYTITSAHNKMIDVTCDDIVIKLKPMLSGITPLFSFGEHSDSSRNLAYAILLHCIGKEAASLLCDNFIGKFLLNGNGEPIKIDSQAIKVFVSRTNKIQLDVQDSLRNAKKL